MLLVLLSVPPVFWGRFGWATPIITAFISIVLMGIEAASVEVEREHALA